MEELFEFFKRVTACYIDVGEERSLVEAIAFVLADHYGLVVLREPETHYDLWLQSLADVQASYGVGTQEP